MKRAVVERNMVVVLFVIVLITFSLAHRDTERITHLYTTTTIKPAKLALVKTTSVSKESITVKVHNH
jgi:hypothetical protein